MSELLIFIIPNFILFWIYLLTFSDRKFFNKNYYILTFAGLIILLYLIYHGYLSWEKGQEISHFGNMIVATSGVLFSLPTLIYLRYKDISPLWVIGILMILPVISVFVIFFFLVITNNIWGM